MNISFKESLASDFLEWYDENIVTASPRTLCAEFLKYLADNEYLKKEWRKRIL